MSELSIRHSNAFTPTTLDDGIALAEKMANSILVPAAFRGRPEDVLAVMILSHEIGIPFMQGLQGIAVINGKASVYGDTALAIVKASPVFEDMIETSETMPDGNVIATCVAKRKNASDVVRTFSFADAQRAGLLGKVGPWTNYPARMCQMRARSFALRDQFADVLKGIILAEEASDIPSNEPSFNDPNAVAFQPALENASPATEVKPGLLPVPEGKKRGGGKKKQDTVSTQAEAIEAVEVVEEPVYQDPNDPANINPVPQEETVAQPSHTMSTPADIDFNQPAQVTQPVQQGNPFQQAIASPANTQRDNDIAAVLAKFGTKEAAIQWATGVGALPAGSEFDTLTDDVLSFFAQAAATM